MERKVYDRNGFEIRKGDNVMVWNPDDTTYIALVEKVGQKQIKVNERGDDSNKVKPSDVEVLYDQVKIKVNNITWDTEDGMDGELPILPNTTEIPLETLVVDYDLEDFNNVNDLVCNWLTDTYNFCVLNYTYEYDRKHEAM